MHPRTILTTRLSGARTHNLRSVDLELSPGELISIVGVSGAGKSSLALDTLYAEGQRRFIESFSPYARQFLERLDRPPVQSLDPVPAAVAVDRRAPVKSSRSTVATMADIEPYLSALFTREAMPVCASCKVEARWTDPHEAADEVVEALEPGRAIVTYAHPVAGSLEYLEVRDQLAKDGFRRLMLDGVLRDIDEVRPSEVIKGRIDVVIDRLDTSKDRARLSAALEQAWARGGGVARVVSAMPERDDNEYPREVRVAKGLSCPKCAKLFEPPKPSMFSFQSPVGACPECRGFGRVIGIDWGKVIPNPKLTLRRGAIRAWSGNTATEERKLLAEFCGRKNISMDVPWAGLSDAHKKLIIEGEGTWSQGKFPGVLAWFKWLEGRTYKMHVRVFLSRYRSYDTCPTCDGKRFNPTSLAYVVAGHNLADWHGMEIRDALEKLNALPSSSAQGQMAKAELMARLGYLSRVGLGYLTLDRQARTLSGGEAQRVSLTAALGTSLTGALFVLDEPTVGLHPSDIPPLQDAMRELAVQGNTVLVIEHDPEVILATDRVIELGPGAGDRGGTVIFDGAPKTLASRGDTPTGRALSKEMPTRVPRTAKSWIQIKNAREHNLRGVNVEIPLGVICAVTGPSGSGKSTLIRDILYPVIARARGSFDVDAPGAHDSIEGIDTIREVVLVDQSPLGRTSRGNPATYTRAWDGIRARYAAEPAAVAARLQAGDFSFNVEGGRCEACSGEGSETVEMQFLADVTFVCATCQGKRFQPRVLEIKHRGHDVSELLEMPVSRVMELFSDDADITRQLRPLIALGLGYLRLGQPLNTLSGGEAQRIKLARALTTNAKRTLFLLDEPSAGLHAEDVQHVLEALDILVEQGGSVVVVEHDVDLVAAADWIIDLGPGAGRLGGHVVDTGTPTALREKGKGKTAEALRSTHQRTKEGDILRVAEGHLPWGKTASTKVAHAAAHGRPGHICVHHAREHNLREISCEIPHNNLVVVTGPSGSGKSTLAFDVVFAEGQRRFLETLTPYARQFLPMMPRADVDKVAGVPPTIALEQRTSRAGANSTVATVTEVAHYLRLLYAKVGEIHCPECDSPVASRDPGELYEQLKSRPEACTLLAPAVRARKGTYLDVFTAAARAGFAEAICDGQLVRTDTPPKLKKTVEHTIDIVIVKDTVLANLERAVFDKALSLGKGALKIRLAAKGKRSEEDLLFSTSRTCAKCGAGVSEIDPRWFSFNTKQGQCEACEGTGIEGGRDALNEGSTEVCEECEGARLAPLPRGVRMFGLRYHELMEKSVSAAREIVGGWTFRGTAQRLSEAAHPELVRRLDFLESVGLDYLALGRAARTLSGGEMQRLRLSAQLGSGLTGALYVLDEPTIGLHPRDTRRLIGNLRNLVSMGSTVMVVEHDADMIRAADHLVDIGPAGGRRGGSIVAQGSPSEVLSAPGSPTATAISQPFAPPRATRPRADRWIKLSGVTENNLKDLTLEIPHGRMTAIAGVSGSGKSTLIRGVLLPAVRKALKLATDEPGTFKRIEGLEGIRRAVAVDQSPIGRTPRSVPATFLGIWDEIRRLYALSPEAKVKGFDASRFSFNTPKGSRCPTCDGQGAILHEMNALTW
ncbi:MAG: excinuclease ABC subunit UvrA [Polyangiaceae bacterium]